MTRKAASVKDARKRTAMDLTTRDCYNALGRFTAMTRQYGHRTLRTILGHKQRVADRASVLARRELPHGLCPFGKGETSQGPGLNRLGARTLPQRTPFT